MIGPPERRLAAVIVEHKLLLHGPRQLGDLLGRGLVAAVYKHLLIWHWFGQFSRGHLNLFLLVVVGVVELRLRRQRLLLLLLLLQLALLLVLVLEDLERNRRRRFVELRWRNEG